MAAKAGKQSCFEFILSIGGATLFWSKLASSPESIAGPLRWLLSKPLLLNLPTKSAWLHMRLAAKVRGADAVTLSLVAHRDNILEGLCSQLGVDETTGNLVDGTRAQLLDVRYEGEAAGGDGLRREWFGLAVAEMLDPDRELFVSKDGNRSLQPNPDSAATAGPTIYRTLRCLVGSLALRCTTARRSTPRGQRCALHCPHTFFSYSCPPSLHPYDAHGFLAAHLRRHSSRRRLSTQLPLTTLSRSILLYTRPNQSYSKCRRRSWRHSA